MWFFVSSIFLLGQKGFPNRDFQPEAYVSSSISTDAERKLIALK